MIIDQMIIDHISENFTKYFFNIQNIANERVPTSKLVCISQPPQLQHPPYISLDNVVWSRREFDWRIADS